MTEFSDVHESHSVKNDASDDARGRSIDIGSRDRRIEYQLI